MRNTAGEREFSGGSDERFAYVAALGRTLEAESAKALGQEFAYTQDSRA